MMKENSFHSLVTKTQVILPSNVVLGLWHGVLSLGKLMEHLTINNAIPVKFKMQTVRALSARFAASCLYFRCSS